MRHNAYVTPHVSGRHEAPAEAPFKLEQMAPRRRRIWPLVTLAVLLTLGGGSVAAVYALTRPSETNTTEAGYIELVGACRTEVTRQLKAPATARFSNERAVELGDRFHYIDGSVDAQNSFGALVRSSYRCKAETSGDGWSVIRVDVAG